MISILHMVSIFGNIIALTVPNNSLFTDNVWIINVLNLLGKFFCTIVAFLIWTYTCEVLSYSIT